VHQSEVGRGSELTPKVVQTLLGHSSIKMTMDIYSSLFRDSVDRVELAGAESALLRAGR
jgi:integrase